MNAFSRKCLVVHAAAFLWSQAIPSFADEPLGGGRSEDVHGPLPAYVNEFQISLPGDVQLSQQGASNVPPSGLILQDAFRFPAPSTFVLPAKTTVFQDPTLGWEGLRFELPDGTVIRPNKSELVGLEVRDSIAQLADHFFPPRSPVAQHHCDELEGILRATGSAPNMADFRRLLLNPISPLTEKDYGDVTAKFLGCQRPELSLDDIRLLHASIRDSIVTFRASWTVLRGPSWAMFDSDAANYLAGKYAFLMDSGALRFDAMHGPSLDDIKYTQVRSYDGTVERVLDTDAFGSRAITHPLISAAYYFESHHPLFVSKLIDTQKDLGRATPDAENFQDTYAYPLEARMDFHGRNCVALYHDGVVHYLDPAMNWAYCGMEGRRYEFDENQGKLIESDNYLERVLDDFRECGDGVWLPMHAEEIRYRHGVPQVVQEIITHSAVVNGEVDPKEFQEIVPAGVPVFDGTRQAAYVQGDGKALAKNLNQSVKPLANNWLRNIVIISASSAEFVGEFRLGEFAERVK